MDIELCPQCKYCTRGHRPGPACIIITVAIPASILPGEEIKTVAVTAWNSISPHSRYSYILLSSVVCHKFQLKTPTNAKAIMITGWKCAHTGDNNQNWQNPHFLHSMNRLHDGFSSSVHLVFGSFAGGNTAYSTSVTLLCLLM